eukprot:scaffold34658_cov230-Amphora_coffeaeformis.AAC.8
MKVGDKRDIPTEVKVVAQQALFLHMPYNTYDTYTHSLLYIVQYRRKLKNSAVGGDRAIFESPSSPSLSMIGVLNRSIIF